MRSLEALERPHSPLVVLHEPRLTFGQWLPDVFGSLANPAGYPRIVRRASVPGPFSRAAGLGRMPGIRPVTGRSRFAPLTEAVTSKLAMKRHAVDILALGAVLVLGVLFYVPRTNPLESRYMYYADSFERAAGSVNPDYVDEYKRYGWEEKYPLITLLARQVLIAFPDDPATAVTVLHAGLALVAGILAFVANRLFLGPLASLYITILLLYDRSLMPVARGLGVMGVLLLAPLLLVFIDSLRRTQERTLPRHRRIVPVILLALSGGLIYSLGGHETLYAVPSLLAFAVLLCVGWFVRSVRARRLTPGPTVTSLIGLASAGAVAFGLIVATHAGIAQRQSPDALSDMLWHRGFLASATDDVRTEITRHDGLLQRWKATFYDGTYRDRQAWGARHENTFLYPGPGFNGMIPLFVYPGLVVGLWMLGQWIVRKLQSRSRDPADQPPDYFMLLNTVLLGVFVAVMVTTNDPKPTRYTPCIYPIFALSAIGYQELYDTIRQAVTWPGWSRIGLIANHRSTAGRVAAGALLLAVCVFATVRLHKNYRDLGSYLERYLWQIPTEGLPPLLEKARTEYASKPVFFVRGRWNPPAVGLLVGYKTLPNVTFLKTRQARETQFPEDAIVFVRDRSGWRCSSAANIQK
jgi:hypothetical protein